MRPLAILFAILVLATLHGCASVPHMPLSAQNPRHDTSRPLYLMTVTITNAHKPRWQPRVLTVVLEKDDGSEKPERFGFRMDREGTVAQPSGSATYLVRFATDAAPHVLRGFPSMASAFPINASYFVPLHADLVAARQGGAVYLGSVRAVIRERNDGEFRAGPPIPLIDQAVAGASTGTFEIEVEDHFDSDVAMFRNAFVALQGVEITKAILAPWDRARAQRFWEQN